MDLLETINWVDIAVITLINLGIGVVLGMVYAEWCSRSFERKNAKYHQDLQKFRHDYAMQLERVRKENQQFRNK